MQGAARDTIQAQPKILYPQLVIGLVDATGEAAVAVQSVFVDSARLSRHTV